MAHTPLRLGRRTTGAAVVAVALVAGLVGAVPSAAAAQPSGVSPIVAPTATTARATALPTAQINGIVWSQAVVGDTVYAGGDFTKARPAGVGRGGAGEVERKNLVAYSLSTGKLVAGFAPNVNGAIQVVYASADGKTLYIGGQFTKVDGKARYRMAAFDTATGDLIASFHPTFDYIVYTMLQVGNTLYVGGAFSTVAGRPRAKLAALDATTGGLLAAWKPSADYIVRDMAMSEDRQSIILAGGFSTLNGVQARGLGSVARAGAGATQSFPVNQLVYASGQHASFFSLATQGTTVYASAYNFGGGANLEGVVAANSNTGALVWLDDCHGDTYSIYATASTVYIAGHTHNCATLGGFPEQSSPRRALAFTPRVTGTLQHNTVSGYSDFGGQPSPSLMNWFPSLTPGTITGDDQAAWDVTGSGPYVLMGGEFTAVNGVNQQGLVRFATAPTSPDTVGPRIQTSLTPTSSSLGAGAVRLAFPTIWDQDDYTLTYTVQRRRGAGGAIADVWDYDATGTFWSSRTLAVADTGLTPGASFQYRIVVTDAAGNTATGAWTDVDIPSSGSAPSDAAPVAKIVARQPASGARNALLFDGTGSTDSDGMVSRWQWDFGDGTQSTQPTITHQYAKSGTYKITLTVTDDDGVSDTVTLRRQAT